MCKRDVWLVLASGVFVSLQALESYVTPSFSLLKNPEVQADREGVHRKYAAKVPKWLLLVAARNKSKTYLQDCLLLQTCFEVAKVFFCMRFLQPSFLCTTKISQHAIVQV